MKPITIGAFSIFWFFSLVTVASAANVNNIGKPDHAYTIKVPSQPNIYVVEFTPKSDPSKTCIYINEQYSSGFHCFDKPVEVKKN